MADHSKNRRRSHFARARQRRGKAKAAKILAKRNESLQFWRVFWKKAIEEMWDDLIN